MKKSKIYIYIGIYFLIKQKMLIIIITIIKNCILDWLKNSSKVRSMNNRYRQKLVTVSEIL